MFDTVNKDLRDHDECIVYDFQINHRFYCQLFYFSIIGFLLPFISPISLHSPFRDLIVPDKVLFIALSFGTVAYHIDKTEVNYIYMKQPELGK